MDWSMQNLGALGEFVGAIAVVVTLAYLAVQIRQNTNSVRGTAELESARMRMEWHNLCVLDDTLGEIVEKAFENPTDLTNQESIRFLYLFASYFSMVEGCWFQYKRGLLDEAGWSPMKNTLLGLLQNSLISEWWNGERSTFSHEFRDYIDDLSERGFKGGWSTYESVASIQSRARDARDPVAPGPGN